MFTLYVKRHFAAALLGSLAVVLAGCSSGEAEPASAPRPTPSVEEAQADPASWPQQITGARLVEGVVGDRGQSRLVRTFTVGDTNLEWADLCDLPSVAPYADGPLIAVSVDDRRLIGSGCVPGDSTLSGTDMSFGKDARDARRGWARLGVKPGDTVTVRLWMETLNGKFVTKPDVRLGFALYERTGTG
jgi:hypothetical protein